MVCFADALRAYFSQYGDVQEAVIAVDPATGRTRGFGFITIGAHLVFSLRTFRVPDSISCSLSFSFTLSLYLSLSVHV
jgi:hypothetical protein